MMAEGKHDKEHQPSPLSSGSKRKSLPSDKIEEELEAQQVDDDIKKQKLETSSSEHNNITKLFVEEYDNEDEDEDEEEYEGEDEDEDEEDEGGEDGEIDRKGKGIMCDDKGKGKMIEESDNDSSDDIGSELDDDADSDISEDPLAEVDLDNILPSRTRQRRHPPQSGVFISDDMPKRS